jgi:hypothetical protein
MAPTISSWTGSRGSTLPTAKDRAIRVAPIAEIEIPPKRQLFGKYSRVWVSASPRAPVCGDHRDLLYRRTARRDQAPDPAHLWPVEPVELGHVRPADLFGVRHLSGQGRDRALGETKPEQADPSSAIMSTIKAMGPYSGYSDIDRLVRHNLPRGWALALSRVSIRPPRVEYHHRETLV